MAAAQTELIESLLPLAERLSSQARRLKGPVAQTKDIDQLQRAAHRFREELRDWFRIDAQTGRHEARNALNKVLGPSQFLRGERGEDPLLTEIEATCTEILNYLQDKPENDPSEDVIQPPSRQNDMPGLILVADDDSENRRLIGRLLTDLGHEVEYANDGGEALEKVHATEYDAVLLDIRMPVLDGFAVLESLRKSGHLRQTPVIVVTGLQGEREAVRCIEIGAEDFLSRPIRPSLLTARLRASLEKKRLRKRVFEQHFTPELARELAKNPDPMKMKGRSADVSVLFCDIRGFSRISERIGPEKTIKWLSGVMGEFSEAVIENHGVLVDYTGDEILALWGAPMDQENHAELACRTAQQIVERLPELNEEWEPLIEAETAIGIGINSGEAYVGNVGTKKKFKYGPLGNTVNLGSRIQSANRKLKTTVLISGGTHERLAGVLPTRRLCYARMRNIAEPVVLHELGVAVPKTWDSLCEQYEAALQHFEEGHLHNASAVLGDLMVMHPGDTVALQLMQRVVQAMLDEGDTFDPVWNLE